MIRSLPRNNLRHGYVVTLRLSLGSTSAAAACPTMCPAASAVPRIAGQVDAQVKVVGLVPKRHRSRMAAQAAGIVN
jgi:hypothetical protein